MVELRWIRAQFKTLTIDDLPTICFDVTIGYNNHNTIRYQLGQKLLKTFMYSLLIFGLFLMAFAFFTYTYHGCGSDLINSADYNPNVESCMELTGQKRQNDSNSLFWLSLVLTGLSAWMIRSNRINSGITGGDAPQPVEQKNFGSIFAIFGIFAALFAVIATIVGISSQSNQTKKDRRHAQAIANQVGRQSKLNSQSRPKVQSSSIQQSSNRFKQSDIEWREMQQRKWDDQRAQDRIEDVYNRGVAHEDAQKGHD